jgi:hypothetical protein
MVLDDDAFTSKTLFVKVLFSIELYTQEHNSALKKAATIPKNFG